MTCSESNLKKKEFWSSQGPPLGTVRVKSSIGHENFSFKLVFYVGEEPLETKLFNEPVVCIFIFRSFRLLWTNPNIHGTIHIIALIIRLSVRNFHVEEPIWARDPLALFWGEIIVSTLLLLVTRSISVFQGQ